MVSSITAPIPARAQPAEGSVKGTGDAGDSFRDALQKTVRERTEASGQEKAEAGKEPAAEEVKPEKGDTGRTEETAEKPEVSAQTPQIFVIPGQQNMLFLLNQGLAGISGQAEAAIPAAEALAAQPEGVPAVLEAGQELQPVFANQAAAQEISGSSEMKTLSAGKEAPAQAADTQPAASNAPAEKAETPIPTKAADKAQYQAAEQQDGGRKTEEKQPEAFTVKTAERREKHSGTEKTAVGESSGKPQSLQNEQPQPHLAVQTAQTQESPQTAQTAGKEQPGSVFRPSQPETLPQELPARLAESISRGGREFTISLEPESLGKMMIKASFEDGKAMVSITCSSAKTLELLSTHAKDMGAIMESHMGTPTNVVVEKNQPDYLAQQQQQGRQNRQPEEQKQQEESGGKQEENGDSFLQQLRLGLV